MVGIALTMVVCAGLLGAPAAFAQPPGYAKKAHATKAKTDEGLLDRVADEVFGRRDAEPTGRGRKAMPPSSNAQWLPDAKRGQERAAERRPAHAGPKHARGEEPSLLDQLLGENERIERAQSKREREKKLGKIRDKTKAKN